MNRLYDRVGGGSNNCLDWTLLPEEDEFFRDELQYDDEATDSDGEEEEEEEDNNPILSEKHMVRY